MSKLLTFALGLAGVAWAVARRRPAPATTWSEATDRL